jgi:hypothetical protein
MMATRKLPRKPKPKPKTQAPGLPATVVLEDAMIASMARDPRFTQRFPSLKRVAKSLAPKRRCGRCGQKNQNRAKVFQAVKQEIASLPQDRQDELKGLLGVTEVRVFLRNRDTQKLEQKVL